MLQFHDRGADVIAWQNFLLSQGFPLPRFGADGDFGDETAQATRAFQAQAAIPPSGILDERTEDAAIARGFAPPSHFDQPIPTDPSKLKPSWPPAPKDLASPSMKQQQNTLGPIEYRLANDPDDPERVIITNDFETTKLIRLPVPQLANVRGAPHSLAITWHRLAAAQCSALWTAWERAGLLSRILTWHGSFNPRCIRGDLSSLSNHAFAAAFDINKQWNERGTIPALVGGRGSVRELVELANRFGFYWGGHFKTTPDGMHFEVARLMTDAEVAAELAKIPPPAAPVPSQPVAAPLAAAPLAAAPLAAAPLAAAPLAAAPLAAGGQPVDPALASYAPPPNVAPLLGTITQQIATARRITQPFAPAPRMLAVLPGGQLYLDSELQLDTDGAPGLSGDATHQSETSLRYQNGTSINANAVPFFVLPLPTGWSQQFGISLGDFAAVLFAGRVAFAVFADLGPKTKIGEGSLELFRQLGQERVRPNGSVLDAGMGPGIVTIVFPGSGQPADRTDEQTMLAALRTRGPALFAALGGVSPVA